MNAAIYCRVSTDDQEREGTSLQTQLQACQKHCQDKGYALIKTFSETWSGTNLHRPQLTQLRDLVAAGKVDVIVIYCLDRISRDPTDGALLFHEFESLAARIEAVTETVESTDLGKLISYIRGFASKLEVEKIRERTSRGKAARLKQGYLPTGSGIGPYGYRWDKPTKKRVLIKEEAAVVERIYSSVLLGKSCSQIAKELNNDHIPSKSGITWSNTTVHRIVANPIYAGETYYGRKKHVGNNKVQTQDKDKWILLPDVTPAIIDKPTFEAAQEAIKQKHPSVRNNDTSYFLTGHIFCPLCGSPICGTTVRDNYRYYRCRGARPAGKRGKICNALYIKADEIETYVWDRLVNLTQSPANILANLLYYHYDSTKTPGQLIPIIDRQIKAMHARLNTYAPREKNLIHLYAEEHITKEFLLEEVRKIRQRETDDKHQIDHLLETRSRATAAAKFTLKLSEHAEKLKAALPQTLTPEAKKEFIGLYGLRVEATPGKYSFCCYADYKLDNEVLHSDQYDEQLLAQFQQELRELETQHPDLSMANFVDYAKELPDDHRLGKIINHIKKENTPSPNGVGASDQHKQSLGGVYG